MSKSFVSTDIESILVAFSQDNNVQCPLCDKRLFLKTIGDTPFLCCPGFDTVRCLTKVGLAKYSSPCHGCYNAVHNIQKNDLTWYWEYTPFHKDCANDIIFEILKLWNKCFEINFSTQDRERSNYCEACHRLILPGEHVAQKIFGKPKTYFHFEECCSGWSEDNLNPGDELKDLAKSFKSYVDARKHQRDSPNQKRGVTDITEDCTKTHVYKLSSKKPKITKPADVDTQPIKSDDGERNNA
jgi:hypothetical protein